MKAANTIISLFVLFLFALADEIPFQVVNKTIGWPTVQFYGKAGDQFQITLQLSEVADFTYYVSKTTGFDQFSFAYFNGEKVQENFEEQSAALSLSINVITNSYYNCFFTLYSPINRIIFAKITYKKNGVLLFRQYQSWNPLQQQNFRNFVKPVYQFQTTTLCKIKVYWQGPPASLTIFPPGIDPLEGIPIFYFVSDTQDKDNFQFNIDSVGKWSIRIQQNFDLWFQHKRGIINITTFTDNKCVNYCSEKPYPVLGLATGTTDICICDPSKGFYLWDKATQRCIYDVCGDNIKASDEQCDNGNQTGCKTGCVFDHGYTCSGSNGSPSVCTTTCGDGVKAGIQQCDNRKQAGCRQCIVQPNYTCVQDVNLLSRCKDNVCGDSFKSNVEECDNGNRTGCINCKITSGYQCSGLLGEQSSCSSVCGDGVKTETEQCDAGDDEGCNGCRIEVGYVCQHNLYSKSLCFTVCGDGILAGSEICDNKNQTGCENCKPSLGFTCEGQRGGTSTCQVKCGDSIKAATEKCDNGNREGCSVGCTPDKGYICSGEDGRSSLCLPICGDGIRVENQACDNGKKVGCLTCGSFDRGYICTGEIGSKSVCTAICGDSIRTGSEQCDNGNQPGCSKNCIVEQGYSCSSGLGAVSDCRTICGDKILAGTEQCDNGKKEGCTNCIVETGYECKLMSSRKTSVCNKN